MDYPFTAVVNVAANCLQFNRRFSVSAGIGEHYVLFNTANFFPRYWHWSYVADGERNSRKNLCNVGQLSDLF